MPTFVLKRDLDIYLLTHNTRSVTGFQLGVSLRDTLYTHLLILPQSLRTEYSNTTVEQKDSSPTSPKA